MSFLHLTQGLRFALHPGLSHHGLSARITMVVSGWSQAVLATDETRMGASHSTTENVESTENIRVFRDSQSNALRSRRGDRPSVTTWAVTLRALSPDFDGCKRVEPRRFWPQIFTDETRMRATCLTAENAKNAEKTWFFGTRRAMLCAPGGGRLR